MGNPDRHAQNISPRWLSVPSSWQSGPTVTLLILFLEILFLRLSSGSMFTRKYFPQGSSLGKLRLETQDRESKGHPYKVFISCGRHKWNPTVHCHQWVLSCQVLGPSVYDPPRLNSELWKVCGFVDCTHGCPWVSNSLLAVRTLKGHRLYILARYMGSHCLRTCRHMCRGRGEGEGRCL